MANEALYNKKLKNLAILEMYKTGQPTRYNKYLSGKSGL